MTGEVGGHARPLFTLDTNILVYAHDSRAGVRHEIAREVVARAAESGGCLLTVQALAELFHVLTRKRIVDEGVAARLIQTYRDVFPVVAADAESLLDAMDAVRDHHWAFWDAMIWAAARKAGCRYLLSEDGQAGRRLLGVAVLNPFSEPRPAELDALLATGS